MKLELAEAAPGNFRYRKTIPAYHRRANEVPAHYRYLQDSSLFSFRLNDGLSTQKIVNLFLTVPDPNNRQAPRRVRIDMFDALPDEEFEKVLMFSQKFNSPGVIDAAIQYRNNCSLQDGEYNTTTFQKPQTTQADTASNTVQSVFNTPYNPTVQPASFWDSTILGVPVKYALPVAIGLYLIS